MQSVDASGSGASLSKALAGNVAAGDLLVAQLTAASGATVSDSLNGAWTRAASDGGVHAIWYLAGSKAGADTITVNNSTSGTMRLSAAEYAGVATGSPLDQTSCAQGTSTAVSTGATPSVAAGDLAYAGVGAAPSGLTVTAGSGFTLRDRFSNSYGTSAEEDNVATAAGAQTGTFTLSSAPSGGWGACIATFKPAGASPPAAPTMMAAPSVSGQDMQGQTLSTSNGSWTGSPTSYGYHWMDCNSSGASCTDISGATSSSYTLQASDVGSTIRSDVTATNSGGSGSADSAATSMVAAPPPAAPTDTAVPSVSGQAVQGQTLSTSNGSWTGSPTSYSYHWQDCNSSGASCVNISGATSSSYTLQASDVGSTIRSAVTATNAGGSGSASSAATAAVTSGSSGGGSTRVGAPTPAGVSCTQTLNAGANVQNAASTASPGSVICLNPGSWSAITLSSVAPASPGVTVAATPGQTVSVPGFTITGTSQNITIEGFNITNGAGNGHGNGIDLLCQINGGVTLTHNTIENISGGDAIHGYSGACGGSAAVQSGVSITYNQLDHASTFIEAQGNACACASADANWTISHNVLGPDENYGGAGHYIQGQWLGATIDNNAFEGPTVFNSNAHNNVLHCYSTNAPGCQNITFDNNIIWHAQSRAQTILISDNNLTNIHIDNNLDIDDPACGTSIDCPASPWFVEKGYGFTLMHNTSVNAVWSVNLGTCGDGCVSNPNTWDAEYNIAVGPPQQGQNNYGTWACQTSCTMGHNTSQDNSATSNWGGTGDVTGWTPAWQNTSWTPVSGPGYQPPPAGYYQPTGLSITGAGYQGTIGP